MRNIWKAAAFAFGTLAFAAPPASAQEYGPPGYDQQNYPPPGYADRSGDNDCEQQAEANGYAPEEAYEQCLPENAVPYDQASGGYCGQYGCPDNYYDMPLYYGPVYYDDTWYTGPLYYRDYFGGRQYWVHGGWHADGWRGSRPSWWNGSRYHTGPALGRNFYESRGFRGGRGNGFGAGGTFNGGHVFNGSGFNSGGRFGGAMDRRGAFAPNAAGGQSGNSGGNWRGRDFGGRGFQSQGTPQRQFNGGGHSFQAQPQHQFNGGGQGARSFGGGNGGARSSSGGNAGGGWHGGGGGGGRGGDGGGHGHR